MGADLGALLDHHHRDVGRKLLEPDRGGEPGRPGADDHHVELHRLAGGQLLPFIGSPNRRPAAGFRRGCEDAPFRSKRYANRSWSCRAGRECANRHARIARDLRNPVAEAGPPAFMACVPDRIDCPRQRRASDHDKAARELLAFYQEAGVDALIGETPVDRFADASTQRPRLRRPCCSGGADRPQPGRDRAASAPPPFQAPRRFTARPRARAGCARRRLRPKPRSWRRARRRKSAASLEELRAILERFEGCALKRPPPSWCSPTATRRRA